LLCATVAATLASVFAWAGPPGGDLAAHIYQRALFLQHGFALWNNLWYSGRYSFVTYSVLYYPLAGLLGIRLLAVATISTATLAYAIIVWRQWGRRTRWSCRAFAVVSAGVVLAATFPFVLGAALALLAVSAAQARQPWRFAALAALTLAASPLALLLLTLVLVGLAFSRRWEPTLVPIAVALVCVWSIEAVIYRVFGVGGRYPFPVSELGAAGLFCVLGTLLTWRVERARSIRFLFPVYGAACLAAYLVPSQLGENVARLRYVALPIAVLVVALRDWRPRPVVVGALVLAIAWNTTPLVACFAAGNSEPSAAASYWQPAVRFLRAHLTRSYRVEVVDTVGHWGADYLPQAGIPIARGWFRQDDFPENQLLYARLGPGAYLHWLHRLAVRYVLLTDAPPEYSASAEAALVAGPRSPLHAAFRSRHLTVYEVPKPRSLIAGPGTARILLFGGSTIVLTASQRGTYRLAIRYSPFLRASYGCLSESPDGMTTIVLPRAATVTVRFRLSATAAFASLVRDSDLCPLEAARRR
jgi:hypothetical protein